MNGGSFVGFVSTPLGVRVPPDLRKTPTAKTDTTAAERHHQSSLPCFGPHGGDPYRFTWWTTPPAGEVWIERGGGWVRGRIASRGRFYVTVEIVTRRRRRRRVRKLYSKLRRVR